MNTINVKKLQQEVPFDQYSRQYQVMTILNELRRSGETFTILDVGGYKGRTADFLTNDTVTILDLYDVDEPNYVQGSALEIPLPADSVDFVTSFDVLEHIPADMRQKFVDECARVAKKGVVICAPHKTPANEYAEQSLDDYYQQLHQEPHPWLKEHIAYGIPDFEKIETYAQQKRLHTIAFPSNMTRYWMSMQQALFANSKYPLASETLTDLNEFYNQNFEFDGGESVDESYRVILCCFADEGMAQRIAQQLGSMRQGFTAEQQADPTREVRLFEKINDYYATLLQKTSQQASDYQELHEHELNRATELENNNRILWERVNSLEEPVLPLRKQLAGKLKNQLRRSKKSAK